MNTDKEIGARLKMARKAAGFGTAVAAAESLGVVYATYAGHENGNRGLRASLEQYARRFGVSADWLLTGRGEMKSTERMAPILGLAGAGPNGTVLFAEGQGNFGEVPAPPGSSDSVAGLEVRGDSMHGLANDGWLLFYEERTEPREEYMGEPCVCWLEDGHVLVKIPEPTLHPGLYNLTSTNAATMRSVAVREMALVTDIRPRRAAQRFIRRNPDQAVTNFSNGHRPESRK